MKAIFQKGLLLFLAISVSCISISPASTASASPAVIKPETSQSNIASDVKLQEKYKQAIEKLDKHVVRNQDGTFRLAIDKLEAKRSLGIDEEIFEQLKRSMEATNQEIQKGVCYSDRNNRVYIKGVDTEGELTRGNRNGYESYWWGGIIYLNSTNANKLSAMISQGVSVATLASFIVSAIPGIGTIGGRILAIMTTVASFGGSTISRANAAGNGIKMYHLVGGTVPVWIESQ